MLILDLWGIIFHAVVVFGLGKDLLFKSVLGRCDSLIKIPDVKSSTNLWLSIPYNLKIKQKLWMTSTKMNVFYPSALQGQKAEGN